MGGEAGEPLQSVEVVEGGAADLGVSMGHRLDQGHGGPEGAALGDRLDRGHPLCMSPKEDVVLEALQGLWMPRPGKGSDRCDADPLSLIP